MKSVKILIVSALSIGSLMTTAIAVAEDGATLYKQRTCFTCHGQDGKTPIMPTYPKIAGQSADYALQQMKDIKDGTRSNGMSMAMKGVMHLVTDEEMKTLSEYLSSLEP